MPNSTEPVVRAILRLGNRLKTAVPSGILSASAGIFYPKGAAQTTGVFSLKCRQGLIASASFIAFQKTPALGSALTVFGLHHDGSDPTPSPKIKLSFQAMVPKRGFQIPNVRFVGRLSHILTGNFHDKDVVDSCS